MVTDTTKLKNAFEKIFREHYDVETAEVLGEIHAVYHVRFVRQMADGPGHGDGEGETAMASQASLRVKKALRRALKADVLAPGPKTDALYDELLDFISSAGDASMMDIQAVGGGLGAEPEIIRTAIARLVHDKRIERVSLGGPANRARYRCL